MSPRAAAAAVARSAASTVYAPGRTRPARRPAPARRRSGPVAKPRTAARPDVTSVLDRLLRGPGYIALVFVLLVGIVFFNVGVLELNHGIARTDVRAAELKRENATLTLKVAKLGSSERIQRIALENGYVLPQPGDVRYLRTGRQDAARALRVMTAPDSSSAAAVAPAVVLQQSTPATATTTPASTTTTTPAPTTTQPAAAPPPPAHTTTPPPTQTTTPAPAQTAPPAAATTQAGAVQAPTTP